MKKSALVIREFTSKKGVTYLVCLIEDNPGEYSLTPVWVELECPMGLKALADVTLEIADFKYGKPVYSLAPFTIEKESKK